MMLLLQHWAYIPPAYSGVEGSEIMKVHMGVSTKDYGKKIRVVECTNGNVHNVINRFEGSIDNILDLEGKFLVGNGPKGQKNSIAPRFYDYSDPNQ